MRLHISDTGHDRLDEVSRKTVLDLYGAADEAVPAAAGTLRHKVESFAVVTVEELAESMFGICDHCLTAISLNRAPIPAEFVEAAIVRRRIEQGIPFEDVLLAFRTAFGLIRDWIMKTARDHGLPADQQVRWLEVLWAVENAGETEFGSRSLRMAHEDGRRSELARASFIRELLLPAPGHSRSARFKRDLSRYLAPEHEYRVIAARSAATDPAEMIERITRATEHHELAAQLIVHEGDVIGVVPRRPRGLPNDFTVAVSDPLSPDQADTALPTTRRVLDAAGACGLAGAHDLAEIGMLLAVTEQIELGALYLRRYVEPLLELGPFGTVVLETLGVLLAADHDPNEAGRRLFVHPNTVRHRLKKAEEVLGLSLTTFHHSRELWWALAAWRMRTRPHE